MIVNIELLKINRTIKFNGLFFCTMRRNTPSNSFRLFKLFNFSINFIRLIEKIFGKMFRVRRTFVLRFRKKKRYFERPILKIATFFVKL